MTDITTTLRWSADISAAPRMSKIHRSKPVTRDGQTYNESSVEFVPVPILALTKCGKVIRTQWVPPRQTSTGKPLDGGRWVGLATGEDPALWALWPDAAELTGGEV